MLSLDLPHVRAATNFVGGLGGVDVTPRTLRWALSQTRARHDGAHGRAPVYIPEGVE